MPLNKTEYKHPPGSHPLIKSKQASILSCANCHPGYKPCQNLITLLLIICSKIQTFFLCPQTAVAEESLRPHLSVHHRVGCKARRPRLTHPPTAPNFPLSESPGGAARRAGGAGSAG